MRQQAPANRHPTLYHMWDFAMRTRYILSELDNVEAGRTVEHPEQIPDYTGASDPLSDPAAARSLMKDGMTRSMTLEMMITGNPPQMLMMMGLPAVDFWDEVKAKATAMMDSFQFDGLEL